MTDPHDDIHRRLERAAQSADDAVRGWRDEDDAIQPVDTVDIFDPAATAPPRRGRHLYPALSAAAVTALAITAVALVVRSSDGPKASPGVGSSDAATAPQRAADALAALIPGLTDFRISVPRDGEYTVRAHYLADGEYVADVTLDVASGVPANAGAGESGCAIGPLPATAFPVPATASDLPVPVTLGPGTGADAPATTSAPSQRTTDPAATGTELPPEATIDVGSGAAFPTGVANAADGVSGCGWIAYGGSATVHKGDQGPDSPDSAGINAGDGTEFGQVRADGTEVSIRFEAIHDMTASDLLADDTLYAVVTSPDIEAGGVCGDNCAPDEPEPTIFPTMVVAPTVVAPTGLPSDLGSYVPLASLTDPAPSGSGTAE